MIPLPHEFWMKRALALAYRAVARHCLVYRSLYLEADSTAVATSLVVHERLLILNGKTRIDPVCRREFTRYASSKEAAAGGGASSNS